MQPFQFPDQVEIGKTASVMCAVVSGKQPFDFKWFKDGKVLDNKIINTQRKISNLVIDPVEKSSGGNYTCIVSNAAGKGSFSATLTIRGRTLQNKCIVISLSKHHQNCYTDVMQC